MFDLQAETEPPACPHETEPPDPVFVDLAGGLPLAFVVEMVQCVRDPAPS